MTPKEQEAAFKRLREKHPRRPVEWASGFVHGLQDAEIKEVAGMMYAKMYRVLSSSQAVDQRKYYNFHYTQGYIEGFTKARGLDIETIIMEALHVVGS